MTGARQAGEQGDIDLAVGILADASLVRGDCRAGLAPLDPVHRTGIQPGVGQAALHAGDESARCRQRGSRGIGRGGIIRRRRHRHCGNRLGGGRRHRPHRHSTCRIDRSARRLRRQRGERPRLRWVECWLDRLHPALERRFGRRAGRHEGWRCRGRRGDMVRMERRPYRLDRRTCEGDRLPLHTAPRCRRHARQFDQGPIAVRQEARPYGQIGGSHARDSDDRRGEQRRPQGNGQRPCQSHRPGGPAQPRLRRPMGTARKPTVGRWRLWRCRLIRVRPPSGYVGEGPELRLRHFALRGDRRGRLAVRPARGPRTRSPRVRSVGAVAPGTFRTGRSCRRSGRTPSLRAFGGWFGTAIAGDHGKATLPLGRRTLAGKGGSVGATHLDTQLVVVTPTPDPKHRNPPGGCLGPVHCL